MDVQNVIIGVRNVQQDGKMESQYLKKNKLYIWDDENGESKIILLLENTNTTNFSSMYDNVKILIDDYIKSVCLYDLYEIKGLNYNV